METGIKKRHKLPVVYFFIFQTAAVGTPTVSVDMRVPTTLLMTVQGRGCPAAVLQAMQLLNTSPVWAVALLLQSMCTFINTRVTEMICEGFISLLGMCSVLVSL